MFPVPSPGSRARWSCFAGLGLTLGILVGAGAIPQKSFADRLALPLVQIDHDGTYQIQTMQLPSREGAPAPAPLVLSVTREPIADQTGKGRYITLNSADSFFVLPNIPKKIVSSKASATSIEKIGQVNGFHVYRARHDGYFRLEVPTSDGGSEWFYLFVSPMPSRHLDRADSDWYLTQWDTETESNCGPSVAAMSAGWARGLKIGVTDVRKRLGWKGAGEVTMPELQAVLSTLQVRSKIVDLGSKNDLFAALERGHLLAVSYDMAGIEYNPNPAGDLRNQYYKDRGGHYLALKGYSLDRRYVIVYDPIPSDWKDNGVRYGDGISMLGRNRYYDVDQLWKSLRTRQAIEVLR